MTTHGWIQLAVFLIGLTILARPLGSWMAGVYGGNAGWIGRLFGPLERLIYRACGTSPNTEMRWPTYATAVLVFNMAGLLVVYALQRLQGVLPLNPQGFAGVGADSALNTAISFASNTNWQGYGGETTMSYLTQMVGLGVQNFVSAATGMAVLVALVRGFTRASSTTIGNFWVDLTRSVLYVLLPLSFVLALFLVSQGVVQTFGPSVVATTLEGEEQTIAVGPAASQVAIKQLGTNGGGFFNVNSAHPLENPTPASNFAELIAILLIPAALCFTFGRLVKEIRQGWAIFGAMLAIFIPLTIACMAAEQSAGPALAINGVDVTAGPDRPGGNMEGKETRFGIVNSAMWATATTAASNGSVNAMHDSFTPLGGLVPMWLMQLGEVIFGGVGSGLYGMLVFAIIAVFVGGLMVGRTPEYLGKKIEAFEMKMAALVILIPPIVVLVGTAVAVLGPGLSATIGEETKGLTNNPGAHGFSEVLYAFSSAGNNNGSAFAGLNANVPFYNVALGVAMFVARYWLIVPTLGV